MPLKQVGVEAVVKGLALFQGDMRKVNSSLLSLRPSATLLQKSFGSITEGFLAFGRSIVRVAEVALGVLLRDAIQAAIGWIRDMAVATFDAGAEFQRIKILLTGFNLDEAIKSGNDYSTAMGLANKTSEEQLQWLQALGAVTPFDPASIANVFSMARSYGFASDDAQRLTKNIIDFTSGMGLSNEVLERVIVNLGQMQQRGKITRTEIRDLTRGAMLPWATILERLADLTGKTTKEVDKQISTLEGIPADLFVQAFNEMVEQEPRFIGAAGRLSRAFLPAVENVKELVLSIGGLNIVAPILDFLGEKVASLVDEFVFFTEEGDLIKTEAFERLVEVATRLSDAIVGVLTDLGMLMPSTEGIVDGVIDALEGIAIWIEDNRGEIVEFFASIGKTIKEDLIPFLVDDLLPAIGDFIGYVIDNKDLFLQFFTTLGDILLNQIVPILVEDILPAMGRFLEWIVENKDAIK
ncbi:MAG: tape measure protein, partial [Anaerolineae bacterium]|nr:tape measure protein [Anaerolineae bacterium]